MKPQEISTLAHQIEADLSTNRHAQFTIERQPTRSTLCRQTYTKMGRLSDLIYALAEPITLRHMSHYPLTK